MRRPKLAVKGSDPKARARAAMASSRQADEEAEPETTSAAPEEEAADDTPTPATSFSDVGDKLDDKRSGQLADDLSMDAGFDRVIDTIFVVEADSEYEEIQTFLRLSGKASAAEYAMLVDRLDEAATMASKALILYANAKVALRNFESELDVIESTIHVKAVQHAEETFSKKPTIADIDAVKKTLYHDEWRACQNKRERARQMVGVLEGLVKVANERGRDLRQMVASSRH